MIKRCQDIKRQVILSNNWKRSIKQIKNSKASMIKPKEYAPTKKIKQKESTIKPEDRRITNSKISRTAKSVASNFNLIKTDY